MAPLTQNTQAILLLTAPLILGHSEASRDLLTLAEYNKLARILKEKQRRPADLLGPDAQNLIELCGPLFVRKRLETLLARGFLLSQAVERWNARAIWVISRADSCYPRRMKARLKENAPPLLYGCGNIGLVEKGGLAVVGSRHVDEELISFTENVGRLVAMAHRPIISGGAKGIDRAAMHGALLANGDVMGVLADSLERAVLTRENREPLIQNRLVLVSPFDPAAGFNVGHAMQRNKVIYALADAGLVVTSDFEKGGTWTGAMEQLKKLRLVPVFVRNGTNVGRGNAALIHHGGQPWPNPKNAADLGELITAAVETEAAMPKQETLLFALREEPVTCTSPVKPVEPGSVAGEAPKALASPAEELFKAVREILRRELVAEMSEVQIMALLGVNKAQTKEWLTKLIEEGEIEKINKTKPARYRTANPTDLLL